MNDPVAERKAQTRAAFNALAPDYDAVGPGIFAHFGRRLVEAAGVAPGQRVLDVASGRGAVLFPAAERVGPAGAVEGIDLAEGMVQATIAEAVRRGLSVRLRVGDAEQLDFPDASFDRALCGFGVMFFPRQAQALAEFRRVLKPDGRIGVSTWQASQSEDLRLVLGSLGVNVPQEPGWITEPERLAALLSEAGFQDVHVTVDTHAFRYDDLEHYWRTARSTMMRRMLDTFDAAQTEHVRAALAEHVRPSQRGDGLYLEARALIAVADR